MSRYSRTSARDSGNTVSGVSTPCSWATWYISCLLHSDRMRSASASGKRNHSRSTSAWSAMNMAPMSLVAIRTDLPMRRPRSSRNRSASASDARWRSHVSRSRQYFEKKAGAVGSASTQWTGTPRRPRLRTTPTPPCLKQPRSTAGVELSSSKGGAAVMDTRIRPTGTGGSDLRRGSRPDPVGPGCPARRRARRARARGRRA